MMEKTFLGLNKHFSIIILSACSMLFTFVSGYSPISNIISFLLVCIQALVFIAVPLLFYLLEKENMDLKKVAGIYTSYFVISFFVTVIASLSSIDGAASFFLKTLFDLVNLVILLSSIFILAEHVMMNAGVNIKVYSITIMKIVYLLGNVVSAPFIKFINKKSGKER